MKFFGFNRKNEAPSFRITAADRSWVEDNIKWLVQVLGYPKREHGQILITDQFFPRTFESKGKDVRPLMGDLCELLNLEPNKFEIEIHKDLRDAYAMPFEIHGEPFEAEMEVVEEGYKIHLANSILSRFNRLVFSLIYEMIKVRLIESKLDYATGDDSNLFIFIAGIYLGFGIPLSKNLQDKGRVDDGFWETKWNFVSEMPVEVMAFGLAIFSKLKNQDHPEWEKDLPTALKLKFEQAIIFINENPTEILNQSELDASDLLWQANECSKKNNFVAGINTLNKILFLTKDQLLKADVYNMMGYYQIRIGEFKKSITNFKKAIALNSNYGYAYDNLGYALIQLGILEEGKYELERALQTENNDDAYTFRNLALYYEAKGDVVKANYNFQQAFENESMPVDLLELHYANFLLKQGERTKGLEFLKKAIAKNEPEAIQRMKEFEEKQQ